MQKIQGPGTAIKFGGIISLKKTFIVPEAMIDKMQPIKPPKSTKKMQAFAGIWGLEDFYSPPDTAPPSLICLGKRRHMWDWASQQEATLRRQKY